MRAGILLENSGMHSMVQFCVELEGNKQQLALAEPAGARLDTGPESAQGMVSEENLKERELTKLGTYTAADGTVTTTHQAEGATHTGIPGNLQEQFVDRASNGCFKEVTLVAAQAH